ncbi:type IV toxin-antitoxin system AbiEi family antitoxin domain-containing protein [Nocardioides pyridinolyticus]
MPKTWTERLADLPADAPFTTSDAAAVGLHHQALHHLSTTGALRHPVAGVYVPAALEDSLRLRCSVLRLVLPPDAFVCDRTASWLHAGDDALAPGEHLAVPPVSCFRPSDGGRLRNALTDSGEREIRASDLMELGGIVVTTPLRTALDLGRLQRTPELRLHGMDTMLGLSEFTHDELLAQVPRFNRRRGVVLLRVLAPLADGGAQSFGETALRLRWYGAGLPRPRTQIPVVVEGRVLYFLDMGLEDAGIAAEYDGDAWHSTSAQRERDAIRRAYLTDVAGWSIEVFRKEHVFGQHQDADRRLRRLAESAQSQLKQHRLGEA